MRKKNALSSPYVGTGALIFWIWSDKEIEHNTVLRKQLFDIRAHGFLGTLGILRASHYEIMDPKVTAAVAFASKLSRRYGMKFWWLADPRLASRTLISLTGDAVDNLITTPDRTKFFDGSNPSMATVKEGKYSIRVEYLLRRRSHMFTDVSLHYEPIGLERVFLFKLQNGKIVSRTIRDITSEARFYVNFNEDYVEVFGFVERKYEGWGVLAFPRFRTNIMDYASKKNELALAGLLREYHEKKIILDGLGWDEPGYCAEFGRFPVSKDIYRKFRKRYGYSLTDKLYGILLDVDDNSHIRFRNDYYSVLLDAVFGWEKRFWNLGQKLCGNIEMGVHQTWHGESAGTEDMVNGSFDLWKGLDSVSGGWSDEGSAERLVHPKEPHYANYITNMVLAKSLARYSKSKIAYYNVWGVDFDGRNPKYPPDVMDYWVDLMGVFSIKWFAHAYGWTGVMNASQGFGPGYPNHPTWNRFKKLNRKIDRIEKFTRLQLPEANIAVVYPIESLMAIGNQSGNAIAGRIFEFVYELTAAGYAVDMISPGFLGEGVLTNTRLRIRGHGYSYVILPYSPVLPSNASRVVQSLMRNKFPLFFDKDVPKYDTMGGNIGLHVHPDFDLYKSPVNILKRKGLRKLCEGPRDAYVSMVRLESGYLFMLSPLRFRGKYEGAIRCGNFSIPIKKSSSIRLIRVDHTGRVIAEEHIT